MTLWRCVFGLAGCAVKMGVALCEMYSDEGLMACTIEYVRVCGMCDGDGCFVVRGGLVD